MFSWSISKDQITRCPPAAVVVSLTPEQRVYASEKKSQTETYFIYKGFEGRDGIPCITAAATEMARKNRLAEPWRAVRGGETRWRRRKIKNNNIRIMTLLFYFVFFFLHFFLPYPRLCTRLCVHVCYLRYYYFFLSYSLSLSLDSRESLCPPPHPGYFIIYDFAKKPFLNKRTKKTPPHPREYKRPTGFR